MTFQPSSLSALLPVLRAAYRAVVSRLADQCDVVGRSERVRRAVPAAQLLASWGLVGRSGPPHGAGPRPAVARRIASGSSTRKLFAFLGQLDRVEAAGFYPNEGNVARWA